MDTDRLRRAALFAVQILRIVHFEQDFSRTLSAVFLCSSRLCG
jgi:hypothetical protein